MEKFDLIMNTLVVTFWAFGMFYSRPEVTLTFWAVPAGWGAGAALADLKKYFGGRKNER